jgi:A1 cistron-splicing factor AAR2
MEIKPTDAKMNTILQLRDTRAEQMVGKDSVLTFAFPRTGVTYSPEVIGRARTEQAMDTSAHIVAVISDRCTYEDSDEVIGELQFCYLTGVLLGNVACQEQWAHIVKVIFKAFRLAMDMPMLFRKLIETIHTQLLYDEEGIEGSIFDHDVYLQDELKVILTVFKSRLNEQLLENGVNLTHEQSDVGKAFEALESWLWKWGWDLRGNYLRSGKIQLEDGEFVDAELKDFEDEDERGEFAPVVVDLDENGRERGLIRW